MILSHPLPKSLHAKVKVEVKCDECGKLYSSRFDHVNKSFNKYNKHRCRECSYKNSPLKGKKRPRSVIVKVQATRKKTIEKKYPKITIVCQCCSKEFIVPYGQRDRIYCGRKCQQKSITHTDIRTTSICLICNKEFKHYGARIVCSRACNAEYASQQRIGENNPAWKSPSEGSCVKCGKIFKYKRDGLHKNQERKFCSLACLRGYNLKLLPTQRTGYPKEFRKIRLIILKRDKKCVLCSSKKKLHVHHINYNKKDCGLNNLVVLCQKCHNMTHSASQRNFWEQLFTGLNSRSKIVKKGWGLEIHIVNHNDYCLKYLIFFKGKRFSFHKHYLKKELWFCSMGKFKAYLKDKEGKEYYFTFKQGDKIEILPEVEHQLMALKNCIITEISTRDYPEDSIRLEKGD